MKHYLVDANVFIRYILQDNPSQVQQADKYFTKAKLGSIRLEILTETILEVEYVLRRVYEIPRVQIFRNLFHLLSTPYFIVHERSLLQHSLIVYRDRPEDLVDIILLLKALQVGAEVLSFDKDFAKMKRNVRW